MGLLSVSGGEFLFESDGASVTATVTASVESTVESSVAVISGFGKDSAYLPISSSSSKDFGRYSRNGMVCFFKSRNERNHLAFISSYFNSITVNRFNRSVQAKLKGIGILIAEFQNLCPSFFFNEETDPFLKIFIHLTGMKKKQKNVLLNDVKWFCNYKINNDSLQRYKSKYAFFFAFFCTGFLDVNILCLDVPSMRCHRVRQSAFIFLICNTDIPRVGKVVSDGCH